MQKSVVARWPVLGTQLGIDGIFLTRPASSSPPQTRIRSTQQGFGQSHFDSRLFYARHIFQPIRNLILRACTNAWCCLPRHCNRRPTLAARRRRFSLQLSKHRKDLLQASKALSFSKLQPTAHPIQMHPTQTQSLPTWAPAHSVTCKSAAFDDEDPLYLSGEETDCDSERGSDTLSREDQQLMASFINLQRERARKQVPHPETRPAYARTTPVLIPSQTHKYVATSTKRWLWDENDEESNDCDQCPCCNHQAVKRRPAISPADKSAAASASDLIFDLEL